MPQEITLPQEMTIDRDGMIRWIYELNMWKNPTLLITLGKVFFLASLVPSFFMLFLTTIDDGLVIGLILFFKIEGFILTILVGLLILAYPFVALLNGGKYCVVFEMNTQGINHIQMKKQFKKNQVVAMLAVISGALTGSLQTVGAGLMAGSRQSMYTRFKGIKKIKYTPKRHVIYLHKGLKRNQIYANDRQYAFIAQYITTHIQKGTIIKGSSL